MHERVVGVIHAARTALYVYGARLDTKQLIEEIWSVTTDSTETALPVVGELPVFEESVCGLRILLQQSSMALMRMN